MTRDDIKRAIATTGATTIQCGLEANERVTVTVLGQDVYLAVCAELRRLWAYEETEAWCQSCGGTLRLQRERAVGFLRCRACGWESEEVQVGMAIRAACVRRMVDDGQVETG